MASPHIQSSINHYSEFHWPKLVVSSIITDKMFGDSEAAAATTGNQADDKIVKLQDGTTCKMSSKSPLSRQNSQDSQNNSKTLLFF